MKISPCIDTIYKGADLGRALREINMCGYSGFEFWSVENWDMGAMMEYKEDLGLEVANFNNAIISLADSRERTRFLHELEKTVTWAKKLGSKRITVLSGDDTGEPRQIQRQSIIKGLREAAAMVEPEGITLVLEASNRRVNRPNNFLTEAEEAFDMIGEVGSTQIKMLYDIYHQQISEGDLLSRIIPNIKDIGHFHAAGVPGRHELHLCEINYAYVLRQISAEGYQGWVGLEYFPRMKQEESLRSVIKYLEQ